ncbi:MAG: hypothetical protein KFF50_04770, partial [Desulfatitalea sp.]|nr:hypothetical protein [Desulfatitalea sp.]
VQRLVNLSADAEALVDLQEHGFHWHHPRLGLEAPGLDFRHADAWTIDEPDALPNCLQGALDPDACMAVMEWRVAPGGSLVMTDGSRLYENRVYGLSTKYGAWNLVEIGYYVRY